MESLYKVYIQHPIRSELKMYFHTGPMNFTEASVMVFKYNTAKDQKTFQSMGIRPWMAHLEPQL